MMSRTAIALLFCSLAPLVSAEINRDSATMTEREKGERVFSLHVGRILAEKCNGCHGDDKLKGDFDTRSLEGLLKGGATSDQVVVPGKADKSLLVTAITWADPDYEMPPKENDRLTENQVTKVKNWINWGAPWPSDETREQWLAFERTRERTAEGVLMKTIPGQSDAWTYRRYKEDAVWAFRPVAEVTPPEHPTADEAHPIDAFIDTKLKAEGFAPGPKASPRELLRRATYDLTGLPPTPEEVEDFEASYFRDPTSAFPLLIDRLLASPRYGERWAQHWLDVVRWADTGGFSNDFERSNGWRYRDYVIRAFNDDKPYHEFILEQLAGDEIDPENPEMLVATGFLRAGAYDNSMVDDDVARQMWLDDLVNGVGQTFLGTPMRCCKCHDHKFDPIPTEDYYRMYATFAGSVPVERPAAYLPVENRAAFEENRELVERLHTHGEARRLELHNKREDAARKWYEERGLPYLDKQARSKVEGEKPPLHVGFDYVDEGTLKVREQEVKVWGRRKERFEPLAQSVWNGRAKKIPAIKHRIPKPETQEAGWTPTNHILLGGNVAAEGKEVSPGVLSACGLSVDQDYQGDPTSVDAYALPTALEGRRLAFAKWVADPANPLATRTVVNRVWGYHFEKALAANPNNIGGKGALPTHPELLDWLTGEFLENGSSLKDLHRLIMTSETYQRSTGHPNLSGLALGDPDNKLLARYAPRRLTAEEIRDTMLMTSGELNEEMGGLPVQPEINREVAFQPRMIQFSIAPAPHANRTPEARNRRSIYTYRTRGMRDPFLQIFNQANPNESCEMRGDAAVSPQAFTLLNSDVSTDRSIALAVHLQDAAATLEQQIDLAFQKILTRPATPEELATLEEFVEQMIAHHQAHEPEQVTYPATITRSLIEEYSGKEFHYEEILPTFENYVPDTKAADVSPETRALADVCLTLYNSNEFVYVY